MIPGLVRKNIYFVVTTNNIPKTAAASVLGATESLSGELVADGTAWWPRPNIALSTGLEHTKGYITYPRQEARGMSRRVWPREEEEERVVGD